MVFGWSSKLQMLLGGIDFLGEFGILVDKRYGGVVDEDWRYQVNRAV